MIDTIRYAAFRPRAVSYYGALVLCVLAIALGGYSALQMEHSGHIITGMNNHVVWGLPHVFAVSLIVSASGALNGATFASVFGSARFKPLARMSVVLAMSILVGGLLVLVLDLGRPDRLIVAMTHYNFRSIFAWNIFLYTGFLLVGVWYLWMMMEKRFNHYVSTVGRAALVWRIILTSGTGCIFGFLVGRSALDTALMAPLFIALSLVMGTAVLGLITVLLDRWQPLQLETDLTASLNRMQLWFLPALAYFSIVHHLTNLYVSEHHDVEQFTLTGGFSLMFWLGHVLIGLVMPVVLIMYKSEPAAAIRRLVISSVLILAGGFALIYVVIIGSQSTPQNLFPGKTVLASSFGDAAFPAYQPSAWEWGLGVGGVFLALFLFLVVIQVLPLVPESLKAPDVEN